MSTKPRSPNYPACSLQKAVEYARKIYAENHLHKAPRPVVAKAMGYGSLNGGSLTAISALKKFGLVDEDDGGVKVTQDALTILVEGPSSPDRARTIVRLATKPELFSELQSAFPGRAPNDEILRSWLLRKGFLQSTVDLPIRAYRETMELAEAQKAIYTSDTREAVDVVSVAATQNGEQVAPQVAELQARPTPVGVAAPVVTSPATVAQGEREWLRGALSKQAGYRLIVSGDLGAREIGKLIKLLEAQRAVLDDDDDQSI